VNHWSVDGNVGQNSKCGKILKEKRTDMFFLYISIQNKPEFFLSGISTGTEEGCTSWEYLY